MKKRLLLILFFIVSSAGVLGSQARDHFAEAEQAWKTAMERGTTGLSRIPDREYLKKAVDFINRAVATNEGKTWTKAWILRATLYEAYNGPPPRVGYDFSGPPPSASYPEMMQSVTTAIRLALTSRGAGLNEDDITSLARFTEEVFHEAAELQRTGRAEESFTHVSSMIDLNRLHEQLTGKTHVRIDSLLRTSMPLTIDFAVNSRKPDLVKAYMAAWAEARPGPEKLTAMYLEATKRYTRDEASLIVQEGRRVYPDSIELLKADVDHSMRIEDTEALLPKLEELAAKDPENLDAHRLLANLFIGKLNTPEAADPITNVRLTEKAGSHLRSGYRIGGQNAPTLRDLAGFYFSSVSRAQQEFANPETTPERRKLAEEHYVQLLHDGLPFFQELEQVEYSNPEVLLFLASHYDAIGNQELLREFTSRLETVQAGGKIPASYFARAAAGKQGSD